MNNKKYYVITEDWSIGYEGPIDRKETIRGIYTDYDEAAKCFYKELEELKKEAESNGHLDTTDEDLDDTEKSWSIYEDGNYVEYHIDLSLIEHEQKE